MIQKEIESQSKEKDLIYEQIKQASFTIKSTNLRINEIEQEINSSLDINSKIEKAKTELSQLEEKLTKYKTIQDELNTLKARSQELTKTNTSLRAKYSKQTQILSSETEKIKELENILNKNLKILNLENIKDTNIEEVEEIRRKIDGQIQAKQKCIQLDQKAQAISKHLESNKEKEKNN